MPGAFGIRRLVDQQLRCLGAGAAAWLRVKNFDDSGQDYAEMGFIYVPPLTGAQIAKGYSDIPITPQPVIRLMSMHNLAMAQAASIALRAGAREVMLSHTWVQAQQLANGFSTPQQVFQAKNVIGIVTESLILSIESFLPDYAYGKIITWQLKCNTEELQNSANIVPAISSKVPLNPGEYNVEGIDGISNVFTLAGYINSVFFYQVFLNGVLLKVVTDYNLANNQLTTNFVPSSTDILSVIVSRN